MPKMKTKRAAAKRYSLTATGKVKVKHAKMRHILSKKSAGTKRALGKSTYVGRSDYNLAIQTLPYAFC